MALSVSDPAPAFAACDQDGKTHRLSDYGGEWLLLYFYPRDDTPGCTKEACAFRDRHAEVSQEVRILGVSGDTAESHRTFAEKYGLPFPLLADPDRQIIGAYGADGIVFAKRTSFLIDPKGVIRKIYEKVDPVAHAGEILEDVKRFKQG